MSVHFKPLFNFRTKVFKIPVKEGGQVVLKEISFEDIENLGITPEEFVAQVCADRDLRVTLKECLSIDVDENLTPQEFVEEVCLDASLTKILKDCLLEEADVLTAQSFVREVCGSSTLTNRLKDCLDLPEYLDGSGFVSAVCANETLAQRLKACLMPLDLEYQSHVLYRKVLTSGIGRPYLARNYDLNQLVGSMLTYLRERLSDGVIRVYQGYHDHDLGRRITRIEGPVTLETALAEGFTSRYYRLPTEEGYYGILRGMETDSPNYQVLLEQFPFVRGPWNLRRRTALSEALVRSIIKGEGNDDPTELFSGEHWTESWSVGAPYRLLGGDLPPNDHFRIVFTMWYFGYETLYVRRVIGTDADGARVYGPWRSSGEETRPDLYNSTYSFEASVEFIKKVRIEYANTTDEEVIIKALSGEENPSYFTFIPFYDSGTEEAKAFFDPRTHRIIIDIWNTAPQLIHNIPHNVGDPV